MSADVQARVNFAELDATKPDWPVDDAAYDVVLRATNSGGQGGPPGPLGSPLRPLSLKILTTFKSCPPSPPPRPPTG
jgi:hypothetical protein